MEPIRLSQFQRASHVQEKSAIKDHPMGDQCKNMPSFKSIHLSKVGTKQIIQ
jgi:hypothetical protein